MNIKLNDEGNCIAEFSINNLKKMDSIKLNWVSDYQKEPKIKEFVRLSFTKFGKVYVDKITGGLYSTETGKHLFCNSMKIIFDK